MQVDDISDFDQAEFDKEREEVLNPKEKLKQDETTPAEDEFEADTPQDLVPDLYEEINRIYRKNLPKKSDEIKPSSYYNNNNGPP